MKTGQERKRLFCAIGSWLALIFVTSSFVVPFHVFVHFVQGLSEDNAFKQWFARFWLVNWIFIVKGWHTTEYAVLVFLGVALLQTLTKWDYQKMLRVAFAFAALFATSDEWHQTFIPGRDGCIRDVMIDAAGAGLAVMILSARRARRLL